MNHLKNTGQCGKDLDIVAAIGYSHSAMFSITVPLIQDFIDRQPSLAEFTRSSTMDALVQRVVEIRRSLSANRPITPPDEFRNLVRGEVSDRDLGALAEGVAASLHADGRWEMGSGERELVALGLLWATLLITEASLRMEECRKEFGLAQPLPTPPSDPRRWNSVQPCRDPKA